MAAMGTTMYFMEGNIPILGKQTINYDLSSIVLTRARNVKIVKDKTVSYLLEDN